ncbi:MAG: 4Fe-4S binding protein [Bacillota bacterium]
MLERTGIPDDEQLARVTPSPERRARGPVAVVECFQEIPCNPCYTSCRFGAMQPFEDINDLPEIDHEKCNGCGVCISRCPGLAIFVVDESYSESEAIVRIPWEFLPLPSPGDRVWALDRGGNVVGEARVERVLAAKAQDRTNQVWLAVPRGLSMVVRNMRARESDGR